jgi:nucleotide-binding universal stress UspA family protein
LIIPKVEISNILYATDLSENAHHALVYAVSMAEQYRARLSLIHVLEEVPDLDERVIGYISGERWEEIKQKHEADARTTLTGKLKGRGAFKAVLGQINEDVRAGLAEPRFETGDILVERGNPVEQILARAEAIPADLIVMGTHGQGTLKDAVMGSTARRVLRRSTIPVLVIRLPL